MIDGPNRKPPKNTRRVAILVFLLGVLVPAVFALDRWFGIAMENTVRAPDTDPTEFHTDPLLRATAVVLAAATSILAGLAMYERRFEPRRVTTITFAVVALALLALNLIVV